ncbi:MAG: glycosyltransferase family 4 protein [Clostridia bacterium]|nr:glycosyltransferase family 4 protein [Clostridia bacterium]
MKLLFYINALGRGGAERVMCNLATVFSEQNHDCTVITSFPVEKEYRVGDQVKRISLFDQKQDCGFVQRNYRLTRELRKLIKKEKPDAVIAFMAEPNFRAIVASMGLKSRVIVSVRNDPCREYPNRVNRILAKTLFRRADGIVFQTEDAKEWFPSFIQKKSEIIYNQVDEIFYHANADAARRDIVTAGRLTPQKNHALLIRAFAAVADRVADNLIIYGEGELRGELEALIAELHMEKRIFLPGVTKNVSEALSSAKLFVLSSDYEGMPNALMEAMAMGIPCISSDCPCGGPKMLFGDALADRLFACGDEKALREKIESVLARNSDGVDEKRLAEQFRPEIIFRKWEAFVKKICE